MTYDGEVSRSCTITYQLHSAESSDPERVDDVEVSEVEAEEERVLCLVPAGKQTKERKAFESGGGERKGRGPLPLTLASVHNPHPHPHSGADPERKGKTHGSRNPNYGSSRGS